MMILLKDTKMRVKLNKVSIVIPCYNEEEAIPSVVPRTLRSLDTLVEDQQIKDYEVIVVNDKSTDNSLAELSQFPSLRVISTKGKGRGYGKALKEGFQSATGDWIAFLDMDNSYRPEDIPLLVEAAKTGDSDFIMGQRPFKEEGMSFTRGLGNWVYVVLAKLIYRSHLEDVCSGFRLFHRRHLNDVVSIPEDGLDFSIHLTLKMICQKTFIKPINIQYDARLGDSKLSVFSDGLSFLRVLLLLKLRGAGAIKHNRV